MKKQILFFLVIGLHSSVFSQKNEDHEQFLKDSAEIMKIKLVRPQFKFDNRITFYKGQSLAINGLDAGVLLKDKLRLTLGYYTMNDYLNAFNKTVDTVDYGRLVKLNYGSVNTEFIYNNSRFFSFGMPLEIALGKNKLQYRNLTENEVYETKQGLILLAYFGLSGTFKPIRWIGLKGIVGYRKTLINQVKEFNFDGFFTSIGLNVDFHEIVKDVRMFKLKKKHRRGDNISNAVDLITD
jgi:hypothetical protein